MKVTSIKKNVFISLAVQIVSLAVSFILNLIVPRFIDEYQYSYWQMYVLYASYVGVLHFGLLDGLVLRYSQFDYDEIDKPRIRSQFQILLLSTSLISLLLIGVSCVFLDKLNKLIFIFVAISIITKNIVTYNSYTFQITNRISDYASLILSQRISYGLITLLFLFLRINSFVFYCIADLLGDIIGIVISSTHNKNMYFGKSLSVKEAILEWKANVKSGIYLMLATWSSFLLIGSSKVIIQIHWNELIFGKVSFAFSMSNLFLSFVTAISVVLFPSLKRMDSNRLPQLYRTIRSAMTPVLFLSLIAYFPGCYILRNYLPSYAESLAYLGILLPIIVYSSKVNLLTNNYLKTYRKETAMLVINGISVVFAVALFFASAFILNNLYVLLSSVVLAIIFNSVLSEIVVGKIIKDNMYNDYVQEFILTALFIFIVNSFDLLSGFILYLIILIAYLFWKLKHKKVFKEE